MNSVKSVDDYIAQAPREIQPKLRELRKVIKEAAPQAEEKISYGMPYYSYKGRLIYFAGWKSHVAVYAMPASIEKHKKEIEKYWISKATLHFPIDKKWPLNLIKKLVRTQAKANEQMK